RQNSAAGQKSRCLKSARDTHISTALPGPFCGIKQFCTAVPFVINSSGNEHEATRQQGCRREITRKTRHAVRPPTVGLVHRLPQKCYYQQSGYCLEKPQRLKRQVHLANTITAAFACKMMMICSARRKECPFLDAKTTPCVVDYKVAV